MKASSSSSMASSDAPMNTDPGQQGVRFSSMDQSCFARPGQSIPGFPPFFGPQGSSFYLPDDGMAKACDPFEPNPPQNNPVADWDPQAMLSNLTFLEQKIKQVKDIVESMGNRGSQVGAGSAEHAAKQQLVTADLTSIIIQLISTAGSMLPSMKSPLLSSNPAVRQLNTPGSPMGFGSVMNQRLGTVREETIPNISKTSDYGQLMNTLNTPHDEKDDLVKCPNPCAGEGSELVQTLPRHKDLGI